MRFRLFSGFAVSLSVALALAGAHVACKSSGGPPQRPVAAHSAAAATHPAVHALPGSSTAASQPAPASLVKVMDLPQSFPASLWALDGALIVTEQTGNFVVIQGDEASMRLDLNQGLPRYDEGSEDHGFVHAVGGRWPEGAWLIWRDIDTWSREANLWYDRVFRLREGRWQKIDSPAPRARSPSIRFNNNTRGSTARSCLNPK